ncbi:Amino acid transporter AVT6C [Linum grandiflorum]
MSPSTGETAPLLPDQKRKKKQGPEEERGGSISGAVFNVSTSIIGAGIMSIPATLKVLGVIPAFLMIVAIAWLADVSVEFLMRPFALFMVVIFVMLPLVMFKRLESLKFSSAVSVLLAMIFVAISSVMAIYALTQGKTNKPRLLPDLDSQSSFFELFTAVPVIVTAFTFHFNGNPSIMLSAVRISMVLCAAIYFAIGIFGYLLFGESIMADILVNFDKTSDTASGALLNDIVRLSYALHLMLVFPLINFSLRANLDEFLFPKKPLLAKDNTRFMSLTFALLVLSYLLAIAIPDIWYFFQFMGSTTAVCLAFIFPGSIVLRDVYGISTRRDRILGAVMIVLAVITSAIAVSSNVYSLIGDSQ